MLTAALIVSTYYSDANEVSFTNPILPGGYPDPSICRVNNTFYMVNSSFEYFPGLPIHQSNDLVNWTLVGYGLHRSEQVYAGINLLDVQSNGGIHAPTLRCRGDKFYIITTNVYQPVGSTQPAQMIDFVVTADNISGPWSDPYIIDGAPGIDPDLFFDDDGRVWYVGTHAPNKPNYPGEGEIWLQELDSQSWQLKGPRHFLWRGALYGAIWAEGPHIYKRSGRYYLMVAEGGTSFDHAVTIAVSDKITGPYIGNARNPILTSRHLSYDNWVHSTGHGDLVELADGRWYMVALGVRGDEQRGSNMGRETHLMPVIWEREPYKWKQVRHEWPVVAPLTGKVERINPLPFSDRQQHPKTVFIDQFDTAELDLQWNFRRMPASGLYSTTERPGYLRLTTSPAVPTNSGRASLMGIRQTESDFEYQVAMEFTSSTNNVEAGVNLFQKDNNYLSYTIVRRDDSYSLQLMAALPKKSLEVLAQTPMANYQGEIRLRVKATGQSYYFGYSLDQGQSWMPFVETRADLLLSRGYTGAYMGLYTTSNGESTTDFVDFDWVRYKGIER